MENQTQTKPNKKNHSKRNLILAVTLIPLAIVLAFVGGYFSHYIFYDQKYNLTNDIIAIMDQVGYIYDAQTGEKRELTPEQVADAIVDGVLDQYAEYFTAQEYAEINEKAKGNQTGIGVSFYDDDNSIDKIVFNSPAELSGMHVGDKIIKGKIINGEWVNISNYKDFASFMGQTKENDQISLEIERNGEQRVLTMQKDKYVASYVKYYDREKALNFRTTNNQLLKTVTDGGMTQLANDTAYIILAEFNGGAGEQMSQAFEFMKERGKTKLIFDLRDNGGGYTNILEDIASRFIYNKGASKSLIAFADGKKYDQEFYAKGNEFNQDITSIVVLANDNTASASECLIGAMLHYKDKFDSDSLIIEKNAKGEARTFGKGIMQTTYGLISGGALKLTTAKMFLPDKTTSIHGVGHIAQGANAVEKGGALARAIEILG